MLIEWESIVGCFLTRYVQVITFPTGAAKLYIQLNCVHLIKFFDIAAVNNYSHWHT